MNTYAGREQTRAKHFILRRYLQALAFKVLRGWDIAYVDGFSGPWESQKADYSDTSFMIAILVLKEAQQIVENQTGMRRKIKCFFSEKDATAFQRMTTAVAGYNRPEEGFEIKTFRGEFVDAVDEIRVYVGNSFPMIFIDPTGWTEYPFTKVAPLFTPDKCEVIINFMYDHVNRFISHPDEKITGSFDPILGGPGWKDRLDPSLKPGAAVERLFRETLKSVGNFAYVVSTKIDKSTEERPHFFLAYGTKNRSGLKAFRETEYDALREHARDRSAAMTRKREEKTETVDLFSAHDADMREATIDDIVKDQMISAKDRLLQMLLNDGPKQFADVVDILLQAFMLRETNVKDICVELARENKIDRSWGTGNRKPIDETMIAPRRGP
jgi:three-Cys-motif partner protein